MNADSSGSRPPRSGLPPSLDSTAKTAHDALPAFLARPSDAPVYHGFTIVDGVEVEGFRLGTISALGPAEFGDAFVIAPDESRAGLVWQVGYPEGRFVELCPFEPGRWGVWGVWFPHPMSSEQDARDNLQTIVPDLRTKWEEWKAWRTNSP